MLNVGMSEILVFAIIALIVLGPDKLPTAVRTVIKWYRHIKLMIGNVQRDIERELEITEIREKMDKELAKIKAIEEQMQAQLNKIQKEVDLLEKDDAQLESNALSQEKTSQLKSSIEPNVSNKNESSTLITNHVLVSKQNIDHIDPRKTTPTHDKAIA